MLLCCALLSPFLSRHFSACHFPDRQFQSVIFQSCSFQSYTFIYPLETPPLTISDLLARASTVANICYIYQHVGFIKA